MRIATAPLARFLLAFGLCAASVACGGGIQRATVTVIIPWAPGTSEYKAFVNVIKPFENKNRIQVILEPTLDVTQQLDADLAPDNPGAGNLPDVADLPSPAAVSQYEKRKDIQPLNGINLSSYDEPWRSLAESKGTVYAIPVKADVKSLIWYKKGVLTSPPKTLQAFLSRDGAPWCLGLASGPTSGWPGDDWVADILLSMAGSNAAHEYEQWLGNQLEWTSDPVTAAWKKWADLMGSGARINGGTLGALKTQFKQALPGNDCLDHGALAATGLNQADVNSYRFMLLPSMSGAASPLLVSGDFMAQFTKNPDATALLNYLAGPAAQSTLVSQGGFAFSADQDAEVLSAYPKGVQRTIAGLLLPKSGNELCFSAEDMMTPDVSAAFSQAVLDYVYHLGAADDHDSISLTNLLQGLQNLQETEGAAGRSPVANQACASP
jgi:alpha-glucoside transport system substrate-binding protein